MTPSEHIRPAGAADRDFLTEMLVEAVNWDPHGQPLAPVVILAIPQNARYVEGWPRPGEHGVVAEGIRGRRLGAAWWRLLPADTPGYGYVADDVPEVSVGVVARHRGRGIGTRLLDALHTAARAAAIGALSLSVGDGNPARRLYERLGYAPVRRTGDSTTMRLDLAPPAPPHTARNG